MNDHRALQPSLEISVKRTVNGWCILSAAYTVTGKFLQVILKYALNPPFLLTIYGPSVLGELLPL